MAKILTQLTLDKLTANPDGKRHADGKAGGLYFLPRKSGVHSWIFLYRRRGVRVLKKLTIGNYPAIGLKDARGLALAAAAKVAAGGDPAGEKQAAKCGGGGEA